MSKDTAVLAALLLLAVLLLLFHKKKKVRNPGGWLNRLFNGVLLVISPMAAFFMAEYAMNISAGALTLGRYYQIRNYGLYFLVEFLFYAITLHTSAAVIGCASFTTIFAGVNVYLIRFRSSPLYMTDLLDIGTAANVSAGYDYRPTARLMILFLWLAVTIAVCFVCVANVPRRRRAVRRAVLIVCGVLLAAVGVNKAQQVRVRMFSPIKSYRDKGGLLILVSSSKYLRMEKPEGYSAGEVESEAEKYPSDSAGGLTQDPDLPDSSEPSVSGLPAQSRPEDVSSAEKAGDRKESYASPNVIVIMDEAFSDLQTVGNLETNEDPIPFWHGLKENTIKGTAYVSVHGGHTANTEYEFLTGDSYGFLPSGTTPYQVYIKSFMPTLTSTLEDEGYQGNIAMHPFLRSGYNRQNVYPHFRFEKCLWQEDFENPGLVRNFISDETDFDRIISEYEQAKASSDAPFWMFNVTMQNHSPYDTDFENLPHTIQITSDVPDKADAERYLNLIHLTDQAAEKLVDYFSKTDDPTVIVMFGDHEPGLSDDFYSSICGKDVDSMTDEERMDLYKVPFFVWCNYDIREEDNVVTSMNYLQSMVLEKLGMRRTGYNKFLSDLSRSVPVINGIGYYGDDGKFHKTDDQKSPYYGEIQEYRYLTYNHLFDAKHRSGIFELAG